MKKQFFRFMAGLIPAIALCMNAHAQIAESSLELNFKEYVFNEAIANSHEGEITNTRASKDFNKRFKPTDRASWFELSDGYAVRCNVEGVDTKAYYDRKGRWYATIRSYDQDKLPNDIRKQVRSTYYDYTIYVVDEVTVGDVTAYLVKISDQKSLKTIRLVNGEMDVYEDYLKN